MAVSLLQARNQQALTVVGTEAYHGRSMAQQQAAILASRGVCINCWWYIYNLYFRLDIHNFETSSKGKLIFVVTICDNFILLVGLGQYFIFSLKLSIRCALACKWKLVFCGIPCRHTNWLILPSD